MSNHDNLRRAVLFIGVAQQPPLKRLRLQHGKEIAGHASNTRHSHRSRETSARLRAVDVRRHLRFSFRAIP